MTKQYKQGSQLNEKILKGMNILADNKDLAKYLFGA